MPIRDNDEGFKLMVDAFLSVENAEECIDLITDLCTILEIQAMSQRVQVAKMLNEKKVYSEIREETGASTATISRVNRSLNYGTGAYKKIFYKLEKNNE